MDRLTRLSRRHFHYKLISTTRFVCRLSRGAIPDGITGVEGGRLVFMIDVDVVSHCGGIATSSLVLYAPCTRPRRRATRYNAYARAGGWLSAGVRERERDPHLINAGCSFRIWKRTAVSDLSLHPPSNRYTNIFA